MLLATGLTAAYKCSSCGAFEFSSISIFKLTQGKSIKNYCRCRKSYISVAIHNPRYYKVSLSCISCGGEHVFLLDKRKVLNGDISIFSCHITGMQICFIGQDDEVRIKIDSLESELDELISKFGYDNYFKNTRVMFDALNIIHDIAEQQNLYCECGNRDIDLVMLPDVIELKCKACFRLKSLKAATNEDLKKLNQTREICLSGKLSPSIISEK